MITPKASDRKPIYMQSVSRKSVYSLVQFRETVAIHRIYGKLTKSGLSVHSGHDFTYNEATLPT